MKSSDNSEFDFFFAEPVERNEEAQMLAMEVINWMLLWMADARTVEERGLRTTVALYCVRPDLLKIKTLEEIGLATGRTRQAVHKLVTSFRATIGLAS